jgi:hypothetical protein
MVNDLAPPPAPPPPFSRLPTQRQTERQLAQERWGEGVGEEPNHTTTRKPGPLYTIQNSLSKYVPL